MGIDDIIHILIIVCILLQAVLSRRLEKKIKATFNYAENLSGEIDEAMSCIDDVRDAANGQAERITALENGVIPNYEEARKAVDSLNDFNKNLNSIMEYDPVASMKKARKKKKQGGDD